VLYPLTKSRSAFSACRAPRSKFASSGSESHEPAAPADDDDEGAADDEEGAGNKYAAVGQPRKALVIMETSRGSHPSLECLHRTSVNPLYFKRQLEVCTDLEVSKNQRKTPCDVSHQ